MWAILLSIYTIIDGLLYISRVLDACHARYTQILVAWLVTSIPCIR